jgi:tetratricopeptide (TPR) repeat protein
MTQQRHAYLIGANGPQQTQITSLQYAEQDVKRLEQAFNTYPCQFSRVRSVIANTSNTVIEGLEEFAETCQNTDLLVVHFSGHAKSENRELYLISNNTMFHPNGRLRFSTTIKMRDIKEILDRCRARHKLLILDCCYSGTALGGGAYRGNDEIEETLEQLKGSTSAILTACSFREKARELDTLNNGQGGGFLSWVITSACTSHFSDVAREDTLSLTDIWNWLENTALNSINGILPPHEQIPRPHLLNDRIAGIDNEIWFTDNRHTFHDDTLTAEQRQREELALLQQEEFLQQYCSGASVEDFDRAKVQEYARLQRDSDQLPMQDIRDLCKRLGLTSGQYTPRRSAVLAFHRMPSRYLHSALVRVTMKGLSSEASYLRDDIEGSLSEQAEQTTKWLKANLNTVSENSGAGQRIDRCEIPERSIRELIVNAILHRNYNARESIHVEITSQQVIITNPGRLDSEIEQVEPSFFYRYSHPQNPVLLRVLIAQRWAEGRSLGFTIIREEFEKYKLPLPEISNLPNGLVQVVIQRPNLSTTSQALAGESSQNVWNVPFPRNPIFTGREGLLQELAKTLQTGEATAISQPQAISGLGGIGKTQIAVEYAYQHRQDYQAILWARADTHEALVSGYVEIAHLLNLPHKDEQDQALVVKAVLHWLQSQIGWLLILDNADELLLVREFLPLTFGGHVLLTTQAQSMGKLARRIEMETMDVDAGALLLLRRAGLIAPDASLEAVSPADVMLARAITQELGGLPLALDQAGAYIEETQGSLADYQQLYQTRRTQLLRRRGGQVTDHPESVATIWSLSFEKVEQRNPAAADLLRFCAYLAPDAIPEEIIITGAEHLGPLLQPLRDDSLAFNEALTTLGAYSLLRRDSANRIVSMHRLVQEILKEQMNEQSRQQWAERSVYAVNAAFPFVKHQTWPHCEQLLPHALQCTLQIERYRLAFPEAVRLLNQMGLYLQERARYQEAEPLLQRALAIREQQLGTEHPDTASSLNNLANLYQAQGNYEQAEPLFKRALSMSEQQLGAQHPGTAQGLNNLANLYQAQGKYEQAEPLVLRALTISEQQLGTEHPDVASSLNNLANLYRTQGKYEQAEPLFKRALAIREQQLGAEHPDTALSLNNLAGLYYNQGKYEQAEPLFKRALAIREQQLGAEHPDTALSLNNLAELYLDERRYEQADPLVKRALAIREQQLGDEHPDTALSLNNLAALYYYQGKYEQAEPLFKRALAIREQRLGGAEHPDITNSLNNLAALYYYQGKYEQAEPLLKRALAIREQRLGLQHPNTLTLRKNYITLLQAMGRDQEANVLGALPLPHHNTSRS